MFCKNVEDKRESFEKFYSQMFYYSSPLFSVVCYSPYVNKSSFVRLMANCPFYLLTAL